MVNINNPLTALLCCDKLSSYPLYTALLPDLHRIDS